MIAALNQLVDAVEVDPSEATELAVLAAAHGTTEYHLRRMFSSLAGMPLSEYVRRRRMTRAAADVIAGDELLTVAVRYGYGSAEAFSRAFVAVHGVAPGAVRRDGGPLRSQPQLRFRLTVEGSTPMDTRITALPALRLAGRATRVPLQHEGVNPAIAEHVESIPVPERLRIKELSSAEPAGLLQITSDLEPDDAEGSELTFMLGVAVDPGTGVSDDLDVIEVPEGDWAVFRTQGPHPQALQQTWAATATDWFPSNPWRLRPGPSIVQVLKMAPEESTATCDLWLPVERS